MPYSFLSIAIVAEVVGTLALKQAEEFTRVLPSLIVLVGYAVSFYFLSLSLRTIPIGIAYALWSGLGIVLIVFAGAVLYGQKLDVPAIVGIGFILAGCLVINLLSQASAH